MDMPINEMSLYTYIGAQLRQRRRELSLSQTELGEAVGLLRTSITNIEAGRQRVPLHVLYQLCSVLQVEIVSILPPKAAVEEKQAVPVTVDGVTTSVSPKTAVFLRQVLEEE